MSTRSGKRIHSSFVENNDKAAPDEFQSERKSRNKRLKENEVQGDISLVKSKKKKNYVSYPGDEQAVQSASNDAVIGIDVEEKTKKKKRTTLKEQNLNITEAVSDVNVISQAVRVTRQTKRISENVEETHNDGKKVGGKKNKNKPSKKCTVNKNDGNHEETKPKKSKKKKGNNSIFPEVPVKNVMNNSNISSDSFHSAAGSPLLENVNIPDNVCRMSNTPESKKLNSTFDKNNDDKKITHKKDTQKRRKSSIKNATFDKHVEISSTSVKIPSEETPLNVTFNQENNKGRKSSSKNATFENVKDIPPGISDEKISEELPINKPLEKYKKKRNSSIMNVTFEQVDISSTSDSATSLSNTFETDNKTKKSIQANVSLVTGTFEEKNSTFDKIDDNPKEPNKTLDEHVKTRRSYTISAVEIEKEIPTKLNSALETSYKREKTLDTTFDKSESKSSLISSDRTIDVTFDKDNSHISVTSDESRTENIVNTSPVLVESSIDESQLSTSKKSLEIDMSEEKGTADVLLKPVTPLKREGTFTKETPDLVNISSGEAPFKRDSTTSPGRTPFHTSRSSQRSILNVTRSLEKPARRSSLAEVFPRQTRVMFCSPVNNPALAMQQRKTIIKSSLKGSNKSFVFGENASSPVPSSARKRSYTQSDAEETRSKRKRLAEDLQQSVNRLSRPRSSSASGNIDSSTPGKKPVTPFKSKSEAKRTKLPNFAALHQRQFDKMESLGDCQRRKAKRARQLMTTTGSITVLERSSPKGIPEAPKLKETIKKLETLGKVPETPAEVPETSSKVPETPGKVPETPAKVPETTGKVPEPAAEVPKPEPAPTLPTLESLRPGYTRFGFKMNTNFNPFSIPSKKDKNGKERPKKLNGLTGKTSLPPKTPVVPTKTPKLSRQPTFPSLNGATSRKEAAKQAVMREKSFTSLSGKRDVKRMESRTIIKGVRTNRRFELQMKMRGNID